MLHLMEPEEMLKTNKGNDQSKIETRRKKTKPGPGSSREQNGMA